MAASLRALGREATALVSLHRTVRLVEPRCAVSIVRDRRRRSQCSDSDRRACLHAKRDCLRCDWHSARHRSWNSSGRAGVYDGCRCARVDDFSELDRGRYDLHVGARGRVRRGTSYRDLRWFLARPEPCFGGANRHEDRAPSHPPASSRVLVLQLMVCASRMLQPRQRDRGRRRCVRCRVRRRARRG